MLARDQSGGAFRMDVRTPLARPTAHPIVFLVLYLPFGALGGFLATVLGYKLKQAGLSTAEIGVLVTVALWPNVLKVIWAPIVDTTLSAKSWYVIGVVVLAGGLGCIGMLPLGRSSLVYLAAAVLALSFVSTIVAMAADILMAHLTAPERKGQAGGWSQAGNVGGSSLGAALGLWLATHVSVPFAAIVVAATMVVCATPLLFLPSESRHHRSPSFAGSLTQVRRDVWAIARSRAGLLALFVLVLPLGTGVAANFFAPIAGEWKASADIVALVAGVAGAAVGLAAVFGGYVCDWMDRKTAYVAFGVIQALVAVGMALAPRTPEMFAIFGIAYAAATGLAFAGYAALTLETIGAGAAATKFNLLASVSNVPLLYVAAIEGPVQTRFSSAAMLLTEAGLALAAALLFAVVVLATRRRPPPALAA
jgi:PAT family beta-lactamase induction signal transducer AmpG